jgi:hypothetical protein
VLNCESPLSDQATCLILGFGRQSTAGLEQIVCWDTKRWALLENFSNYLDAVADDGRYGEEVTVASSCPEVPDEAVKGLGMRGRESSTC